MKMYQRSMGYCFATTLLVGIFLFGVSGLSLAASFCVADKTALMDALEAAQKNENEDVIQIQQGTYNGNFIYASNDPQGLTIKGGYTEGCASRVVDPSNTVIDAQNAGSPLVLSAPNQVTDFAIEGLTLQNGFVQADNGGGIYILLLRGSVSIAKCAIIDNALTSGGSGGWGGGVYVKFNDSGSGTVTLTENTIGNNNAIEGGGIFIQDAEAVTLTHNTVENNSAPNYGGAKISAATVTLIGNRIEDNTAFISSGGINIGNRDITMINNQISSNRAWGGQGGGAVISSSNGIVDLRDNLIINNHCAGDSTGGGGLHVSALPNSIFLANNIISHNSADGAGGGIFAEYFRSFYMVNNTISYNSSNSGGGGIYLRILNDSDIADFYNNIIWGNEAPEGKDLSLYNDADGNNVASPVTLFHNDWDQSMAGTYIQIPFPFDPSNLNNEDPLFADAENGDYHLTEESPCLDQGDNQAPRLPARDKDGRPRIVDADKNLLAVVDLGAYEYGNPRGDLDGDGDVDGDDLIIFTQSYATYVGLQISDN